MNNGENAAIQARLSPFGPHNCITCGDRLVDGSGHTCWIPAKLSSQETLQPILTDQAALNERLLRDDGEPVSAPPPYINRGMS